MPCVGKQDVRAILNAHPTGRLVIHEYESTGMLIRKKHEMNQILVAELINRSGDM
jgi:hypothetical protein